MTIITFVWHDDSETDVPQKDTLSVKDQQLVRKRILEQHGDLYKDIKFKEAQ